MRREHELALLGPDGCLVQALAQGESVVLRVAGACMSPHLSDGDEVRVERARLLIPGDLVAFHCREQDRLLVHRFLGYLRHRRAWRLLTMADRGLGPDPLVAPAHVLGRVVARGDRATRIPPTRRVESVARWLRWCALGLVRRLRRRAAG